MTEPKGRKGRETKSRLLKAAAHEFANNGFHETKVSTIVKNSGLTQPSFYLYFSSKDAVFEELVTSFQSKIIKLSESVRLEGGIESNDIAKRIVTIIESVFQFLVQDPDLTRIGLFLSPNAEQIRNELTQIVKTNLEAEQRLGYFRYNLDMEIVAECIIGVIEHFTATHLLSGSKEPRILAQQIVDLFINGMLPIGDSFKTT